MPLLKNENNIKTKTRIIKKGKKIAMAMAMAMDIVTRVKKGEKEMKLPLFLLLWFCSVGLTLSAGWEYTVIWVLSGAVMFYHFMDVEDQNYKEVKKRGL